MTANPSIVAASASKDATSTLIIALLNNSGRGMVQMRAYLSSLCTTEDAAMRTDWCVKDTNNIYISELYQIVNSYKPVTTAVTSACLRAFTCSSGENCDTLACSTWNSSFNSEKNNLPMSNAFGISPLAVSGLVLTPGNGSITASWGDVGQSTSIWAYDIVLLQGTTVIVSGTRLKNNMTISNLVNGVEYTVSVRARSFDDYIGPYATLKATPVAPCTNPVCGFTLV